MKFKKAIVWEKWIDPLNSNIDEVEYPGYDIPSEDEEIEFLSSDPDFEEKLDSYMESSEEKTEKNISINPMRMMSTPHGFISMTEHSFASKHFDFWTLHYNRDLTEDLIKKIEKCEGVETLTPLTRYRARIGFNRILIKAEAVNLRECKKQIEECILGKKENKPEDELQDFSSDVVSRATQIIKDFEIDGKRSWFLYVFPNGSIEYMSSDSEGYLEKNKTFEEIESLIGGKKIDSI